MIHLEVEISSQTLSFFRHQKLIKKYLVSTAKNGAGEVYGSEQTPRGLHIVRAKIGGNALINSVFIKRRLTGEIYSPELAKLFPERDWILTRIMWLSGLEPGKNRLGNVDTMRRKIYIHGTPDSVAMGLPGSRGCIRMHNQDIIELFKQIPVGSKLLIK